MRGTHRGELDVRLDAGRWLAGMWKRAYRRARWDAGCGGYAVDSSMLTKLVLQCTPRGSVLQRSALALRLITRENSGSNVEGAISIKR